MLLQRARSGTSGASTRRLQFPAHQCAQKVQPRAKIHLTGQAFHRAVEGGGEKNLDLVTIFSSPTLCLPPS